MSRKITLQHVHGVAQARSYNVLSDRYHNAHTKLLFECPKGDQFEMTWTNFQQGQGCPTCGEVSRRQKRKIDFDFIRHALKEEGYVVLSTEYRGARIKLKTICPEGKEYWISWANFRRGHRCPSCVGEEYRGASQRLSFQEVKQRIEKEEYILLSTTYQNCHTRLKLKCSKGHKWFVTWANFKQGHRCGRCNVWRSQEKLGKILEGIFPGKVISQDNLGFLGRQSVDYSIDGESLAFEYDGEHHFMPVCYGGMGKKKARQQFKLQQKRDARKDLLCKENNYVLIRIPYTEELTAGNIIDVIKKGW